jgi:hypothetical protein
MGGIGASATDPNASGPVKTPAQVLSELVASLTMLLDSPLTMENQEECNVEVAKICEQMAKAQEDINTENARMTQLQAQIHSEVEDM